MGPLLAGRRIAVTRAASQAYELAEPLRQLGAQVDVASLIRVQPAPFEGELRAALADLNSFDWLVFTSVNGVELFLEALRRQGGAEAALARLRIACVGPATAAAAARHGLHADALPDEFIGDALPAALAAQGSLQGKRVFLARAGGARSALPEGLRERGARVSDVEVYRSVADEAGATALRALIEADLIDVVTFTSSSTVRYFCSLVGSVGRALVASIGPATSDTARQLGLTVAIEADPHTVEGLVTAISRHFRRDR